MAPPREALRAVFARADWLNRTRVRDYSVIFLVIFSVVAAGFYGDRRGLIDRRGQPVGTDFITLYAGGVVARQGAPASVYDHPRFHAAEKQVVGSAALPYFGWYYPPYYLFVAWPLALLPYLTALFAFAGLTFAALAAVVWRILPSWIALLVLAAFPGTFINLGNGQNGFLTAALLGGGLVLLRERPALAGCLFGLLCIKPQMGLLLPLALAAGGHWRAILAAAATVLGLALLSLGLFGAETWRGFLGATAFARGVVLEQGGIGWPKLISVFAALRQLGASITLAYAAQAAVALGAVAFVVHLWRRRDIDFALKAACLSLAGLLATPYGLDYDLAQLALPIAWIVTLGMRDGFRDYEKFLLALAWVLPLGARAIATVTAIQLTPILLIALLWTLHRRAQGGPAAALR